jgi:glycolate oxidase
MRRDVLDTLERRFGSRLRLSQQERRLYGYDATGVQGLPDAVIYPDDVQDVLFLVQEARRHGLVLVARGSGTGLSGGSIAREGSLVLSFERMRRLIYVDPVLRHALVEAGHVNGKLDPELAPYGLFYPPDPASYGVSTIGGNVAENAGGPHAVKYGVTGNHVVAVRLVDAFGRVGTLSSGTVQGGSDLVSLVVGSEGTLGLLLTAEIALTPQPEAVATQLVSFRDMREATDFVSAVVAEGIVPSTLEFLDRAHVEAIEAWGVAHYPEGAGAVLLIEHDGLTEDVKTSAARTEEVSRQRGAIACQTTRDEAEREGLWLGRRGAYAVIARYGRRLLTQDVTVPRQALTDMLGAVERIAAAYSLRAATVGHAGDGNLHPIFPYDPADAEMTRKVHAASDEVMQACVALDGSISGEHGIGEEKLHQMVIMYPETELGLMAAVRAAFDPEGILNPGKAIPPGRRRPPQLAVTRAEAAPIDSKGVQQAP